MGFNKVMTKYFHAKRSEFIYSGSVVTLGRQDIGVNYRDIDEIGFKVQPSDIVPSDIEYLKLLGFLSVDSIEYSLMDGATIAQDLNEPLKMELYNRFDWIIDGGTLEHCFDVKEYMSSMIKLLKPGGHILHINPSAGSCNHGLFNFQPTFYFSFYGANGFEDLNCDLLEMYVAPKKIFTDKNVRARVIPVQNYNNFAFNSSFPTYNMFHARKPISYNRESVQTPIQEFYYQIFKEKQKIGGGLINDSLYQKIRGDVHENSTEFILQNSFWL